MNDIRNFREEFKAPEDKSQDKGTEKTLNQSFISQIKQIDIKEKKKTHGFYILYIVISIFYFLLYIINPDPDLTLVDRITGSSFIFAFLLFIFFAQQKVREYNEVEYGGNTIAFLVEAEKRFRFFKPGSWIFIPLAILIDIGSCLTIVINYWPSGYSSIFGVLIYQVIFIIISGFALYLGRLVWKQKYGHIRNKILSLLKELQ